MTAGIEPAGPAQSVDLVAKADEVMSLMQELPSWSVAQLSTRLGEPRSSVYRVIAALEQMGFVEATPSRSNRYQMGIRLFDFARTIAGRMPLRQAAAQAMAELSAHSSETVFLMIRRGRQAVCIDRVDGARVRSMAVEIGGALPLHVGAAPLVLLAFMPEREIDAYLSSPTGLSSGFPNAIDVPDLVRDRLAGVREQGYAVSDEDVVPGIASIGAPVYDAAGSVVAALSVGGAKASIIGGDAAVLGLVTRRIAASFVAPVPSTALGADS